MRRSSLFILVPLVLCTVMVLRSATCTAELAEKKRTISPIAPPAARSGKRGGRFLGLLGLLTGLSLVEDSFDDDSDRPRRSGFVKIDVGRPPALDAFYGAYGYGGGGGSPYWPGGQSSINIKIPFRPGGDFETMALFPFPVPFPSSPAQGSFGPFVSHGGPAAIEPRPSLFADPVPSASNGSETIVGEEVDRSTRKTKARPKKSTLIHHQTRTKVSPPRTIRSTLAADEDNTPEEKAPTVGLESPDTTETIAAVQETTATDDSYAATTTYPPETAQNDLAEELPKPPSVSSASIVQEEVNYVTQPAQAGPYASHPHSLADAAAIELTTSGSGVEFQPSRADHWQDFYSSSQNVRDFLPIAIPA